MTADEIQRFWPLVRRTFAFRSWAAANEARRFGVTFARAANVLARAMAKALR